MSEEGKRAAADIAGLLRSMKDQRGMLAEALRRIAMLNPSVDSDEGYNEWGEADCFNQAQKIATEALEQFGKP